MSHLTSKGLQPMDLNYCWINWRFVYSFRGCTEFETVMAGSMATGKYGAGTVAESLHLETIMMR